MNWIDSTRDAPTPRLRVTMHRPNTRRHSSPPDSAFAGTILRDPADACDSASDFGVSEPADSPVASGNLFGKITRLASLPLIADRILRLPLEAGGDEAALVDILQTDPATAATILRRVNSSYFGMSQKVNDLTYAATLLGVQEPLVCSRSTSSLATKAPRFAPAFPGTALTASLSEQPDERAMSCSCSMLRAPMPRGGKFTTRMKLVSSFGFSSKRR